MFWRFPRNPSPSKRVIVNNLRLGLFLGTISNIKLFFLFPSLSKQKAINTRSFLPHQLLLYRRAVFIFTPSTPLRLFSAKCGFCEGKIWCTTRPPSQQELPKETATHPSSSISLGGQQTPLKKSAPSRGSIQNRSNNNNNNNNNGRSNKQNMLPPKPNLVI